MSSQWDGGAAPLASGGVQAASREVCAAGTGAGAAEVAASPGGMLGAS